MDLHPPGESDPTSPTDARRLGRADLKVSPRVRRLRRFWRTIPSAPRCKMCTSPFGPPAGPLLRLIGKGRWAGNSDYCAGCFKQLYRHRDGAEIECTLLFADIRGSTQLAESMSATDFRGLVDRFYRTAAEVLIEHEAIVDKFVGDEVVGDLHPGAGRGEPRGPGDRRRPGPASRDRTRDRCAMGADRHRHQHRRRIRRRGGHGRPRGVHRTRRQRERDRPPRVCRRRWRDPRHRFRRSRREPRGLVGRPNAGASTCAARPRRPTSSSFRSEAHRSALARSLGTSRDCHRS